MTNRYGLTKKGSDWLKSEETIYTPTTIRVIVPLDILNIPAGHNVTSTAKNFCITMSDALARLYPTARVDVDWSMFETRTSIVFDGDVYGDVYPVGAAEETPRESVFVVLEDTLAGRHGAYSVK